MYGVVDFIREAKKRGIHPVIGCEVYVCPEIWTTAATANGMRDHESPDSAVRKRRTGYQNLIKLVSEGLTRGFYYQPRIDYGDCLTRCSEGPDRACRPVCRAKSASAAARTAMMKPRARYAREMSEHFRQGSFLRGDAGSRILEDEKRVVPLLVQVAAKRAFRCVATNDVPLPAPRRTPEAQEVLMCIQTGKTLDDTNRMRMETDELYVKSEEEMRAAVPRDAPRRIERTEEIAERCHVEFDFGETRTCPRFPLPERRDRAADICAACAEKGLAARYQRRRRTEARERMEYELGVISQDGLRGLLPHRLGFHQLRRSTAASSSGPGRGSAAPAPSSPTALDITAIDPLQVTTCCSSDSSTRNASLCRIST